MPRKESTTAPVTAQSQQDAVSDGIDHYELPKTLVTRIAKSCIPETAKLQKETVSALVKGSTVFINYLAATAHDIATSRQHKSVSASDVLKALELIQFGDMVEPLQRELQVYRDNAKAPKRGGSSRSGAGAGESVSAGSKNGDAGASASTAKGKGKERAGPSPLSASISAGAAGDADEEMLDAGEQEGEEEGMEDELAEEEDELADDMEEEEEPVDQMALDEEELRRDQRRADLGAATQGTGGNEESQ